MVAEEGVSGTSLGGGVEGEYLPVSSTVALTPEVTVPSFPGAGLRRWHQWNQRWVRCGLGTQDDEVTATTIDAGERQEKRDYLPCTPRFSRVTHHSANNARLGGIHAGHSVGRGSRGTGVLLPHDYRSAPYCRLPRARMKVWWHSRPMYSTETPRRLRR